jgi:prepilin-type N-terminal cleavage/methylation domain-containing protein/prepilin-type processing-associated H-X9-DG protein
MLPKRAAFTLIELLIVIAIIGVLVSLSVMGASAAIGQARILRCGANLKNIGLAWTLYLDNNQGLFPKYGPHIWWYYGGRDPCLYDFTKLGMDHRPLNPYVNLQLRGEKAAETFRCPQDRPIYSTDENKKGVTEGHSTYEYFGNCYVLNPAVLYLDNPETKVLELDRFGEANVEVDHSSFVLTGDCQWYYYVNEGPWDAAFHGSSNKANLLFLDGHVSYMELVAGKATAPGYTFDPRVPRKSDERTN